MTRNERLAAIINLTGWSYREVARRVNDRAHTRGFRQVATDASRVGRWIGGEHPRGPVAGFIAEIVSERLGHPILPEDLGLITIPTNDALAVPWVPETVLTSLVTFTGTDLMLSRRELAALAVGGPLLGVAQRLLGSPLPPLIAQHRRRRIGIEDVAAIEDLAKTLRSLDAAHGGNLFRRATVGQLKNVAELLREGQDRDVSRRLYVVAADLSQLAGWMSHDAQLYGTAQRYWAYGLAAARTAGEMGRGAEIVSRMAHQMVHLGYPRHALDLLDVADRAAYRDDVPRLVAMLCAQRGRMHAALGDATSALHHLDRAREQLDAAATTDTPEWIKYFTHAELAGAAAVSHRDLRELHQCHGVGPASVHFADAVQLREPGYDRCTAMDLIGLTAAQFVEGDVDAALATADASIEAATRLDSALIRSRIQTLLNSMRDVGGAAIAELRERAEVLTNPDIVAA